MIVTFAGILEGYDLTTTVLWNGTFSITEHLVDLITGIATAQTEDDEGAESNLAETLVVIS
jgi:hypothetical protein